MTKLSDIHLVLLSSAAARPDGNLLPPPETIAGQSARIRKAIPALLKRELVVETETSVSDQTWQEEGERKIGLAITAAGRTAIGIEGSAPEVSPKPGESPAVEALPAPARVTKKSNVLSLLRRSEGATLAELVETTGWLPHTTRAALTGLRKKGHAIAKGKRGDETCYSIVACA
jgi:hypothetical protein